MPLRPYYPSSAGPGGGGGVDHKSSGNALGIWICGCRCILESFRSQNQQVHIVLEASNQRVQKVMSHLRVRAPAAPVLTHSLYLNWRQMKENQPIR